MVAVLILVLAASFGIALAASFTQQAKLTASGAAAGDYFGWAIGIGGDTMVVAAPLYEGDSSPTDTGAAYVFVRSGGSSSQQAKLTASDVATSDEFGYSVAIDGDTIVVGAKLDDDDGTNSGSAYVFAVPTPTPTPVVPSLGECGLIALAGLLAAAFVWRLRGAARRTAS